MKRIVQTGMAATLLFAITAGAQAQDDDLEAALGAAIDQLLGSDGSQTAPPPGVEVGGPDGFRPLRLPGPAASKTAAPVQAHPPEQVAVQTPTPNSQRAPVATTKTPATFAPSPKSAS